MDYRLKSNHWKQLGLKSVDDLKKHIQGIFDESSNQEEVLIGIYRMAFPDWDRIRKINGYPAVGYRLWKYICELFQSFDRKQHPNCMPGGAWMNQGFSVDSDLGLWEITFNNCNVEYVPDPAQGLCIASDQ